MPLSLILGFARKFFNPARFAVRGYQVLDAIYLHRAYRNLLRLLTATPHDSRRLGGAPPDGAANLLKTFRVRHGGWI